MCRKHGACSTFVGQTSSGDIIPFCGTHGRDCEQSEDCKQEGLCISWAGGCIHSCDENAACANGFCRVVDGECAR